MTPPNTEAAALADPMRDALKAALAEHDYKRTQQVMLTEPPWVGEARHALALPAVTRGEIVEECARKIVQISLLADQFRCAFGLGLAESLRALSSPQAQPAPRGMDRTPIMQAADNASKVVEGWSDSKREYAKRIMDKLPQTHPLDVEQRLSSGSGAINEELRYAHRLAEFLWDKHWRYEAPDWKPLPDILGVLTQIDNMVAGLSRPRECVPQNLAAESVASDEAEEMRLLHLWFEQQIENAEQDQISGFAEPSAVGTMRGERAHARNCALFEAQQAVIAATRPATPAPDAKERRELTDDQIMDIVRYSTVGSNAVPQSEWVAFARAILAATDNGAGR